jgi:four helix bundle protein
MDFRDLNALHAAHDLAVEIHDVSQSFPADDQFPLGAALCGMALEIPACLAEGCGRTNEGALAKAIESASGHIARLEYLILLAAQVGAIDEETLGDLTELLDNLKAEISSTKV